MKLARRSTRTLERARLFRDVTPDHKGTPVGRRSGDCCKTPAVGEHKLERRLFVVLEHSPEAFGGCRAFAVGEICQEVSIARGVRLT